MVCPLYRGWPLLGGFVFTRHFLSSLARAHKQKGLVTKLAYSNQTVLLGCNRATISDVTLKILTGRQILSSHIPLKIHAYNRETVLLGCNGATISDVTPPQGP